MSKIYKFLNPGLFLFSIGIFLFIIIIFYESLDLPSNKEIVTYLRLLFEEYGLIVVLIGAIIESLFMISIYLPGSAVIILSVILLGDKIENLLLITLLTVIGFTTSNFINYFLGKYGYYKILLVLGGEDQLFNMKKRFEQNANRTIAISGFHPNFLAIAVVSAGIIDYGLLKTFRKVILSTIIWVIIWVSLVSIFANSITLEDSGKNPAIGFLILIFLWGLGTCVIEYYKKKFKN